MEPVSIPLLFPSVVAVINNGIPVGVVMCHPHVVEMAQALSHSDLSGWRE